MSGRTMFAEPRSIRRGVTLTLVFGAVLATGAATGSFGRAAEGDPAPAAVRTRPRPYTPAADRLDAARLARAIDDGAVGPQDAAALVSRSGDRWAAFYTAQEYEGFQQELDGRYTGVGLWVRRAPDGVVRVSRVQDASPARRAGVRTGDRLVAVDGTAVTGRPVTEVVARLRGAGGDPDATAAPRPGSPVRLVLRRGARDRTVTLRRAVLTAETVTVSRPGPGILQIAVDSFPHGTAGRVRRALAAGDHRRGVLLDLRGNSGGLVTEAVEVASAFLDGGLVARYDVHGRTRSLYAAQGGDTTTPLVVLVDGGTMSAAELLAGALQDRGRAVVAGSPTFGKGSVQMPSTLPDGSVAELTVGHYRTPSGRTVDGHGIRPDLTVAGGRDAGAAAETVLSGLGTAS
ncbi:MULTISPECIES: S41 family peptidase [Streptomycetaceae]|uniref:Putative carboxy-terminal processing protease n=1 Tax=Streptantibioticus cattleyicolor (strain ATCC 35852 / DSM 46488 / JCM 4925 / NBRC 14057 / NRRL 8057) TaxID=1003195 RepID=F8JUE1_STREN|nr:MULTISPECIES: S41 family peptidase [Streptomycetaceae]AEW94351.1 putative carboxy-terminal processing protease precursor [Streptantibioticus cattleyicolor NRRL 8057 = DSM 46488]MYS59001.1 PDZ domain-containing protein [Streptomyces sp. SID5468]CCB74708.1 putative carboxy-terminal processing protease [Streptantibioticus cattleyicolor NRRL 8057 = DSM 46488]